jgi:hypothetical protein
MKKYLLVFAALFLTGTIIFSCKQDRATPDTTFTDAKLFALVKDTSGSGYYKDNAGASDWSSDNAHGGRPYKLRLNAKGYAALTASGKLPANGVFPDSTLLVKELHTTAISDAIADYSVFYKLNGSWNYAQYKNDGSFGSSTVVFSLSADAANCKSCHNSPSTDNVLTFLVHP